MDKISELISNAKKLRCRIVELSNKNHIPHLGSAMSTADIMAVLYWDVLRIDPKKPLDPDRDRFILSKGHAASSLYNALSLKGFFPESVVDKEFNVDGGRLSEHPGPQCVPGIEAATGSLGHGLGIGLGMAIAGRALKKNYRVFVMMSDGECNEGSTWEAALLAAANKVDNLVAFVDYNKWQATGRSNEITKLEPLRDKWEAFGWEAYEIDGHNINEILETVGRAIKVKGKPAIIVANTVKGKGVSFMEDDNNWHYRMPTDEEVKQAWEEINSK